MKQKLSKSVVESLVAGCDGRRGLGHGVARLWCPRKTRWGQELHRPVSRSPDRRVTPQDHRPARADADIPQGPRTSADHPRRGAQRSRPCSGRACCSGSAECGRAGGTVSRSACRSEEAAARCQERSCSARAARAAAPRQQEGHGCASAGDSRAACGHERHALSGEPSAGPNFQDVRPGGPLGHARRQSGQGYSALPRGATRALALRHRTEAAARRPRDTSEPPRGERRSPPTPDGCAGSERSWPPGGRRSTSIEASGPSPHITPSRSECSICRSPRRH